MEYRTNSRLVRFPSDTHGCSLKCCLDPKDGRLISVEYDGMVVEFDGITADIGCDGDYLLKSLVFDSMLDKHTWDLPMIQPCRAPAAPHFLGFKLTDDALAACYGIGPLEVRLIYSIEADSLKVNSEIINQSDKEHWINCFAFITRLKAHSVFDFPANMPCGDFDSRSLEPYKPVCAGLVNSCIHSKTDNIDINFSFIDSVEKWASGVWHSETCTNFAFVPALEAMLPPGRIIKCGSLYIQPVPTGNPYLKIRELHQALGYRAAQGGINDGIMYSCHPHGPMDANFPFRYDMFQYADYLDDLKDLGIDHVWLLPIFVHPQDENSYHTKDQTKIDPRYGTDAAVRHFCDKAHSLGMTVLFDYVPHGPSPEETLARDNPDWCSKRQDGSLQIEWNCVSFDYNHPGYQEYTANLVYDHVKRFGIDGARIDCAMGGLSNWKPHGDNRPSGNSVKAGVNITRAIREGFLRAGKRSFITPENFNPIPNYYPYTDVFYGMNLYRVFCELDSLIKGDPARYAELLTTWLEREYWSTPSGYAKMRFLGNHDTVSWVWQAARAVDYYGLETAKALWAVISLIDGMPMIYQGDEDPAWYLREGGPNLKSFFKELFRIRKDYTGSLHEIEYIHTGMPVMAFFRFSDNARRLVLINLSQKQCILSYRQLGIESCSLLAGNASCGGSEIALPPFEYAVFGV